MAWSIFTQGGGQGAAVTWAKDLLSALGVPQSQANIQFVYDWEVSEGGGGKYNPLNQGPVPGHPELTTTGSQYGGGAADFASWQAGIQGAVDYIHMSAYSGILQALKQSSYSGARSALIASPWAASHYGGGSGFSSAAPPGATSLATGGGDVSTTSIRIPGTSINIPTSAGDVAGGFFAALLNVLGLGSMKDLLERLGLIILGFALVLLGIHILASGSGKSAQPINITTETKKTAEGTTTTSRKINTPVSKHTKTTTTGAVGKTAEKSGLRTGAAEAVEAAAVA